MSIGMPLPLIPAHCSKANSVHHQCPFHLARAEIEGSTVLVVNHALLLADLDAGSQILARARRLYLCHR